MKYRMKLWAGVGAAALMQAALADGVAAANVPQSAILLAAASEGGEGGEAGIDPAAARNDPVVFLTALDVIRAHYFAGLAAYAAGNKSGAQELFVHPISEVFVDFKPVLVGRGGADFQGLMEKAGEIAGEGKPEAEVSAAAKAVLAAADKAEGFAPPAKDAVKLQASMLAEFLGRAARQYSVARKSQEAEPYLDGLGLYLAASQRAQRHLGVIGARNADAAKKVAVALARLREAYPGVTPPAGKPAMPDMLADVSTAQLALSGL